ncbi:MAG: hypothetical protein AB8D78_06660 [Akkermansiaceae bacterium]
MSREEPTIEAEVVEIDGVAVEPNPAQKSKRQRSRWQSWGTLQGKMRKLDSRWWPLWFILGFVLLILFVAIGMVAAVLFVCYKVLMTLFNGMARLLFPSSELQRR